MSGSTYFNKHCDASILQQYRIDPGHQSLDELATSMSNDLREDHFDSSNTPDTAAAVDQPADEE